MSGSDRWERQKREIESYNTFHSSVTGRASDDSFIDRGYIVPAFFPVISDQREGIEAEPDFVLYDGFTFLMVEVKSGDNFEDRHEDQLEELNGVTIERAEEFISNTNVPDNTSYGNDVGRIEVCIVYQGIDESYIDNCRNNWPDCSQKLDQLEELAPVLAQGKGSRLRIVAGEFESGDLNTWLSEGIELPTNPMKAIFLTDEMERESLAVAMCQIWGGRAASGAVTLTPSDVTVYFNHRELGLDVVISTFEMLVEFDACERTSEREYTFKPSHVDRALNIQQIISNQVGTQSGLSEFG